ncbi:tetratricopeptide repeat protein [Candidatus Lokiarchaeum ossiferum]|uniref:tetratricopeptide repeat protein n=1 Tax=Candidatus Lokiarchaeum ossiferum TaxID=2951803 RepID=UPI00352BD611
MNTFSKNQYMSIKTMLEEEGYRSSNDYNCFLRYSIAKEPETTFILGIKIPIQVPNKVTPKAELVSFYISLSLRPRWLDQSFEDSLRYLAVALRETVQTLLQDEPYRYDFNFVAYQSKITQVIEKFYSSNDDPTFQDSSDGSIINSLLRSNVLQNQHTFDHFNLALSKDVLDIYQDFHLHPTDDLPAELSKGFPENRRNFVVLFKREDPDQYLIEEPGSVTYYRDYVYNNVWIRTGLESHTLNLWYQVFQDQSFKINYLIYDWIIFCRGLIKKVMPLLENGPLFNPLDIKNFSYVQFLKQFAPNMYLPGLFLPQLVYENTLVSDYYCRDFFLFESIPCSLEETSIIEHYSQAKILIGKGNYSKAEEAFKDILHRLKKFHHILGEVAVLFKLAKIARIKKNHVLSVAYLEEALDLARSGKVPLSDIVHIHIELIYSHIFNSDSLKANQHKQIVVQFLKDLPANEQSESLILRYYLDMARLSMMEQDFDDANLQFKELLKRIDKHPDYEFLYYYERSKYYAGINNEAKQFQALQKAVDLPDGPKQEHIEAFFDLGLFYLYQRNDHLKAIRYVLEAEAMIQDEDLASLQLKLKCKEVLADAYQAANKGIESEIQKEEAEKIKARLDHLF